MKTLFTLALIFFMNIMSAQQVFNIDKMKKTPKTEQQLIGTAVSTDDTAIYNGVSYKVYKSSRGKLFFVYKNKNNNYSKKYINTEVDTYVPNNPVIKS